MKEFVREITPSPFWNILKAAKYGTIDFAAVIKGRPPADLVESIGGNLDGVGEAVLRFFIDHDLIKPSSEILEIGCGIGRVAIPLTGFISHEGQYCGFDIVKRSTNWCSRTITKRFPNFQFYHADIYNKTYNDAGKLKASKFLFPYADASFDFVFLTSVFTHMLPDDVAHYFSEIQRVMKPGAKFMATWFLLNDDSMALIRSGKAFLPFEHRISDCLVANADIPEVAIAYKESHVLNLYKSHGMTKYHSTEYGSWCGRKVTNDYVQDVCVYAKGYRVTTDDESFAQTPT